MRGERGTVVDCYQLEVRGQRLEVRGLRADLDLSFPIFHFPQFHLFLPLRIFRGPNAWIDFAPSALFVAARRLEARGGPARLEFKIRAFAAVT